MILITGATGFVGRHLAAALLNQGRRVRLLGRNFAGCEGLVAAGAEPLVADLRDYRAVMEACKGAAWVYHAGALSAPWGRRRAFAETNIGGTAAVLAGCKRHGAERLVYVSSPSVTFDGRDQVLLDEQAPYPRRFASHYSWSKKVGEDLVHSAAHWLDAVIVRPKGIFGPGDTALLPRIVAAARAGRLPLIGDAQNKVDITYIDNLVAGLLLAGERSVARGRTYLLTNGEHVLLWDVIRLLLRRLGLPEPLRPVPLDIMLAAAGLMEARACVTGVEPLLTRYTVALLGRTQTYAIAAARRDLGYAPAVSIAEGVELTLERLARSG